MQPLRVTTVLQHAILVSRESAREMEGPLRAMVNDARGGGSAAGEADVIVNFDGVAGIAPSFVDELLSIFDSLVGTGGAGKRHLIVANPPTRLSSKFEAVARGHAMSVHLRPDGSWCLT